MAGDAAEGGCAACDTQIALIERWINEGREGRHAPTAKAQYDIAHPPVYVTAPAVTSVELFARWLR